MNLQVFPNSGKGLGPGTSSQDLMDGDNVSNTEVSMAAWVDRALCPWTGQPEILVIGGPVHEQPFIRLENTKHKETDR